MNEEQKPFLFPKSRFGFPLILTLFVSAVFITFIVRTIQLVSQETPCTPNKAIATLLSFDPSPQVPGEADAGLLIDKYGLVRGIVSFNLEDQYTLTNRATQQGRVCLEPIRIDHRVIMTPAK